MKINRFFYKVICLLIAITFCFNTLLFANSNIINSSASCYSLSVESSFSKSIFEQNTNILRVLLEYLNKLDLMDLKSFNFCITPHIADYDIVLDFSEKYYEENKLVIPCKVSRERSVRSYEALVTPLSNEPVILRKPILKEFSNQELALAKAVINLAEQIKLSGRKRIIFVGKGAFLVYLLLEEAFGIWPKDLQIYHINGDSNKFLYFNHSMVIRDIETAEIVLSESGLDLEDLRKNDALFIDDFMATGLLAREYAELFKKLGINVKLGFIGIHPDRKISKDQLIGSSDRDLYYNLEKLASLVSFQLGKNSLWNFSLNEIKDQQDMESLRSWISPQENQKIEFLKAHIRKIKIDQANALDLKDEKDASKFEKIGQNMWDLSIHQTSEHFKISPEKVIEGLKTLNKQIHSQFRYFLARDMAEYLGKNVQGVNKIWLFGSVTQLPEDIGPHSDIDLIIEINNQSAKGNIIEQVRAIERSIIVRFNLALNDPDMQFSELFDLQGKVLLPKELLARKDYMAYIKPTYNIPAIKLFDINEDTNRTTNTKMSGPSLVSRTKKGDFSITKGQTHKDPKTGQMVVDPITIKHEFLWEAIQGRFHEIDSYIKKIGRFDQEQKRISKEKILAIKNGRLQKLYDLVHARNRKIESMIKAVNGSFLERTVDEQTLIASLRGLLAYKALNEPEFDGLKGILHKCIRSVESGQIDHKLIQHTMFLVQNRVETSDTVYHFLRNYRQLYEKWGLGQIKGFKSAQDIFSYVFNEYISGADRVRGGPDGKIICKRVQRAPKRHWTCFYQAVFVKFRINDPSGKKDENKKRIRIFNPVFQALQDLILIQRVPKLNNIVKSLKRSVKGKKGQRKNTAALLEKIVATGPEHFGEFNLSQRRQIEKVLAEDDYNLKNGELAEFFAAIYERNQTEFSSKEISMQPKNLDFNNEQVLVNILLENIFSILLSNNVSEPKLVLAFHKNIIGFNQQQKIERIIDQLEKLKLKPGFDVLLKNLVILKDIASKEELSKRSLQAKGINITNKDTHMFYFSPEGLRADFLGVSSDINQVYINEGTEFDTYTAYYPIAEIVTMSLLKYQKGYSAQKIKEKLAHYGVKLKDLQIDNMSDSDRFAFMIFKLIPAAEMMIKDLKKYDKIRKCIEAAA